MKKYEKFCLAPILHKRTRRHTQDILCFILYLSVIYYANLFFLINLLNFFIYNYYIISIVNIIYYYCSYFEERFVHTPAQIHKGNIEVSQQLKRMDLIDNVSILIIKLMLSSRIENTTLYYPLSYVFLYFIGAVICEYSIPLALFF